MFNQESLEYLVGLGANKDILVETDRGLFSKDRLVKLEELKAETLTVSNLTSLVDFVITNIDKEERKLLIQVISPSEVRVLTPLTKERDREELLRASAYLPSNIRYDNFLTTESFNIMLQSSFVDNEDKATLLRFTGLIRDEAVKDTGDDGISQSVVIKTGVASVADAQVPNPVTLAPYRTFGEVEQPESQFIFRMKAGPTATLIEADGGAWQNQAMGNIRKFIIDKLKVVDKRYEIIS